MQPDRRDFLKNLGVLTAAGGAIAAGAQGTLASVAQHEAPKLSDDVVGVLVDTTACVGCRLCEYACKKANGLEAGELASYEDQSVFKEHRRPAPGQLTTVNAYQNPQDGQPVYAKIQCMHCNHCACASACIVGALKKQENGAVTYDAWKCIGCRYCMVACPFQLPAYTYEDVLTPQIVKCQLCFHDRTSKGETPGCVAACPREALTFGKRHELLDLAKKRIADHPGKYVDHVYGEKEIGGTSWLYLSSIPFDQLGFQKFGDEAPPALTEKIQHGVFSPSLGMPPALLYGGLAALMWWTGRRKKEVKAHVTVKGRAIDDGHAGSKGNGKVHEGNGQAIERGERASGEVEDAARAGGSGHEEAAAHHEAEHHHDEEPQPVPRKLLTPGVFVLLGLMAVGFVATAYRFLFGLGASTNLDQQHPWGLWIAIDVASGVALAAGGFTSAFLTHVLHREKYHAIARPALLTAMLGYTFVCLGLQADLGRFYNVWHPMIMWNGNSVLFEVGMCVMCYLHVLYLEFAPIGFERLMKPDMKARFPRVNKLAAFAYPRLEKVMFLLVIAGCVLSCLHQSSLGNLMVIAPYKLHALWWTPISPLLFLLSAIAVGFPMIIFESMYASWSLKLKPEAPVLSGLAKFVPFTLGVYLTVKIGDMLVRGTYSYLGDGSLQSTMWLIEVGGGVVLPLMLLVIPAVRRSMKLLWIAATLVVLGVVLNRVNVFLIGYNPPYATKTYFPSWSEIAVTVGLIATLIFLYRVIVTYLPVISLPKAKDHSKDQPVTHEVKAEALA